MKVSDRAAFVLGTWFGCGESPLAPGTVGSLGAVPLHLLLCRLAPAPHVACILLVTAVGTWAAERIAQVLGQTDPQRVVVDEVAGTLIAMGMVRDRGLWPAVLALALFRLFDVTKPGPIRKLEHAKPPGLGIMLDDLLAGVFAGAVVYAVLFVVERR